MVGIVAAQLALALALAPSDGLRLVEEGTLRLSLGPDGGAPTSATFNPVRRIWRLPLPAWMGTWWAGGGSWSSPAEGADGLVGLTLEIPRTRASAFLGYRWASRPVPCDMGSGCSRMTIGHGLMGGVVIPAHFPAWIRRGN